MLVSTRDNFFHFFGNSKIVKAELALYEWLGSGIGVLILVTFLGTHPPCFGYDFSSFLGEKRKNGYKMNT